MEMGEADCLSFKGSYLENGEERKNDISNERESERERESALLLAIVSISS